MGPGRIESQWRRSRQHKVKLIQRLAPLKIPNESDLLLLLHNRRTTKTTKTTKCTRRAKRAELHRDPLM